MGPARCGPVRGGEYLVRAIPLPQTLSGRYSRYTPITVGDNEDVNRPDHAPYDRLGCLVKHENARKVYEGLYALIEDPTNEGEPGDGSEELGIDTPTERARKITPMATRSCPILPRRDRRRTTRSYPSRPSQASRRWP